MRYILSCLASILISTLGFSQNFKITGTLLDGESGTVLESATVFLETAKDSVLITYSISGRQGNFTLEGNSVQNEFDSISVILVIKAFTKNLIWKEISILER